MTVDATQPVAAATSPAGGIVAGGGRVRRAVLTWSMGAVYSVVTILIGFVATPILLRLLTAERIGANRAAGEWLGYLVLADVGMGSAFGVMLMRARQRGLREAASIARFALRTLALMTLVTIPLGLLLAWQMPALVKINAPLAAELRYSALILVAGLALAPLGVFRAVLETGQRGYIVNAALLVQSIVITGLSLWLAWLGWGLIGLSVATLVGGAVFAALSAIGALRHLGGLRGVPTAPVRLRDLWSLSWPLAAVGAGTRLSLMTDAIVIGFMLGSTPVAILFLTQRLIVLVAGQITALANASWAGLSELLHAGDVATFEARLAEIIRLMVGAGIVVVGTTAAYSMHFVRLWVGAAMYGGDLLAILTAAGLVTFGFLRVFVWLIDMRGDTRSRLPMSVVGSLLNVALSIVFVSHIGLPGVALGTLVAYLATDAWYSPMFVCKRLGVRARPIVAALARALAAGIPFAAGAWVLAHSHVPAGWFAFATELALVMVCAAFYCWGAVLSAADRAEWRHRFRRFKAGRT